MKTIILLILLMSETWALEFTYEDYNREMERDLIEERSFHDFHSIKKDMVETTVVESPTSMVAESSSTKTDGNDNVYITNVDSGTVRLLPTLKSEDTALFGTNIRNVVNNEINSLESDLGITGIFNQTIKRENIDFSTLNNDHSIFVSANQPLLFDGWSTLYRLPGWYSEQTESSLISDIDNDCKRFALSLAFIDDMDSKKSSFPTSTDESFFQIPVSVNGTLIFNIPSQILNLENKPRTKDEKGIVAGSQAINTTNFSQVQTSLVINQIQSMSNSTNVNNSTCDNCKINNQSISKPSIEFPAYIQENDPSGYTNQNQRVNTVELLTRTRVYDKIITQYNNTDDDVRQSNTFNRGSDREFYDFFGSVEPSTTSNNTHISPLYGLPKDEFYNDTSEDDKNKSICGLQVDEGNCYLILTRYYFDILTKTCTVFNYTGCGGNLNNFLTIAECQTTCINGYEVKYTLLYKPKENESDVSKNVPNNLGKSTEESDQLITNLAECHKLTLNFIITQIWKSAMNDMYSVERIELWDSIQLYLNDAFAENSTSHFSLESISRYYDPYLNIYFTKATVGIECYDRNVEAIVDSLIEYASSPKADRFSYKIIRESIKITDEPEDESERLCQRMEIPMISECNLTIYGCCEDGIMAAVGPDGQGCPETNCPCDEFLFSFVIQLDKNESKDFHDESTRGSSLKIYNSLVDYLNNSYAGKIIDVYLDYRKCDAHLTGSSETKEVYIIDMAILLKYPLNDPFDNLAQMSKDGKIGKINIVPNSLIFTAGYGTGHKSFKRSIIHPRNNYVEENLIFRLPFNEDGSAGQILDASENLNHFYPSVSYSNNLRRTLPKEYTIDHLCSGTFYPKRNEIASLDFNGKNLKLNELTFSMWMLPLKLESNEKKSGILYAVGEKEDSQYVSQKIWPAIKIDGKNISATWGDMTCSTNVLSKLNDEWSHIVVYYNTLDGVIEVYKNGKNIKTCIYDNSEDLKERNIPINSIILGDSVHPFEGAIDEVVMYKSKLTEEKIVSIYKNCKSNEQTCKPECPPKIKHNQDPAEQHKIGLYPISTCYQYLKRCSRLNSGIYKLVLESPQSKIDRYKPPYMSLPTYCDMSLLGGGWTLLLNNPVNSKWRYDEILSKNKNQPSTTHQFSVLQFADKLLSNMGSTFEYLIKVECGNNINFGAVVSVKNENISLISQNPSENDITLVRKFGNWTYFNSSISQRMPYISFNTKADGIRYPSLKTSTDTNEEGVLIDTYQNTFKIINTQNACNSASISYWIREGHYVDEAYRNSIDISSIDAEITAYYFSVQIINRLDQQVIIEYVLAGSHQFVRIKPRNYTILYTLIQSITMPTPVSIRAYYDNTQKNLYLNCREELTVPIFYLKDDLFIAELTESISMFDIGCETQYPDLYEFYYDYIIRNNLNEEVMLKIDVLNISNTFTIPANNNDDWKGIITYIQDPKYEISAWSQARNVSLLLNGALSYYIKPLTQKNMILMIDITDPSKINFISKPQSCYYNLEIVNDAIMTVDVMWRDDILVVVVDPGEQITVSYELKNNFESSNTQELLVSAKAHDIKLSGVVEILLNKTKYGFVECSQNSIPTKFFISSNISDFQALQEHIKSNQILLDQQEEQVCPPIIHGGYSQWSEWSECENNCPAMGKKTRHRECNFPTPENGGLDCLDQGLGNEIETTACMPTNCSNIVGNKTTPLVFDLNPTYFSKDEAKILLEFINSLNQSVSIHLYTYNSDFKPVKFLNFTITNTATKLLGLNETVTGNSSFIKIKALDYLTRQHVPVMGKDQIIFNLTSIKDKQKIVIGSINENVINIFYYNVRFINNAQQDVKLVFSKENRTTIEMNKYIDDGSVLGFRSKLFTVSQPPNYFVSCFDELNLKKFYLNGKLSQRVYPFTDRNDVLIIIIDAYGRDVEIFSKVINLIFYNSLPVAAKIIVEKIFESSSLEIKPQEVEYYYQRIYSPIELFINISGVAMGYNHRPILIDSRRYFRYMAEQQSNIIRLFNVGFEDITTQLIGYNLKIRVVNLNKLPSKIVWRRDHEEMFLKEGREIRMNYVIYSSISPPVFSVTCTTIQTSLCFVNGRNSTFMIPSTNQVDYMTILLSDVSEYTLNSDADMIDVNITIINKVEEDILVKMSWTDPVYYTFEANCSSSLLYRIKIPASDPLVFKSFTKSNNKILMVNDSLNFGLMPSQFINGITLSITKYPKVKIIAFKFINENTDDETVITVGYGSNIQTFSVPKSTAKDQTLRLLDKGVNESLVITARISNQSDHLCFIPFNYEFQISQLGLDALSQLSELQNEIPWIVLPFKSVHGESIIGKVLAVQVASKIQDEIYILYENAAKTHYMSLDPASNRLLIFMCFDNCQISTLKLWSIHPDQHIVLLNGLETIVLPFNSQFSTSIAPISLKLEKSEKLYQQPTGYNYTPLVVNTVTEPVILMWKVTGQGWTKYIMPQYSIDKVKMNFTDLSTMNLMMKAMSYYSKNFYLINGVQNYTQTPGNVCKTPNCETSDKLIIHEEENEIFEKNNEKLKFSFDNRLSKSVIVTIQPGDHQYEVEPLGMLLVDFKIQNYTKENINKLNINVFDKETRYNLKLNDSTSGVSILYKEFTGNSVYLMIKPPDLPVIPTHSYTFNEESASSLKDDIVNIHGKPKYHSTYFDRYLELQGIVLDGQDRWVGINLPTKNCITNPEICHDGLSIIIRFKIPNSNLSSNAIIKILDTGSESGSSSGVSVFVKNYKLNCRLSVSRRTWNVFTAIENENEIFMTLIWNQEEGLSLLINGTLVATDSSGESILYAAVVEMSPNVLIGRGFNVGSEASFILYSLAFFAKNLREKESVEAYLYLVSNKLSKANITNLRLVNDFGRTIRIVPNRGIVPSGGIIIKPSDKIQILSLIDLPTQQNTAPSDVHQRSQRLTEQISIYAEDYEYGVPLCINNRQSPYSLRANIKYEDFINIVISSKIPELLPIYHWVLSEINETQHLISKTYPPVYFDGKVLITKGTYRGIFLDGLTTKLQIPNFNYQCIFSPGSCDRGTTIFIKVKLEESLGGTDNTLRFILDTGGHHGSGFSIYLLSGRIVAEVSINKQIWKLESGISFGEWLMITLVWDPTDGGKLELYSNGKLLERSLRSAEKQGFSNLRNNTIYIGTSSVRSGNEKYEGARFSIKMLSIFDEHLDKSQVLTQFFFYWNHNQPVNYPRYINTNFENRAGVDAIIKPDKGEHQDEGYSVNNGLMLELRLEEKGPITTYPVIFKAFDSSRVSRLLISGEESFLVMSQEDQSKIVEATLTSRLSCVGPTGLFKDPSDKSYYIICKDEIAMRQKCPSDSLWDEEIKSCLNKNEVEQINKTSISILSNDTILPLLSMPPINLTLNIDSKVNDTMIVAEIASRANFITIFPESNATWNFQEKNHSSINLIAFTPNQDDKDHFLINGKLIWSILMNATNISANISVTRSTNFSLSPGSLDNQKRLEDALIKVINKTEVNNVSQPIIPQLPEMTLTTLPPGPLFAIRFAFIVTNMVDAKIRIVDKLSQLNSIELKNNQSARVFLEGQVSGQYVTFKALSYDQNLPAILMINGLNEIKIPTQVLKDTSLPPGALVVHTPEQNWTLRRDNLLKLIHSLREPATEYKKMFLRVYKTFSEEAMLKETSGSFVEVKLKKSDSMIDKNALDLSLKIQDKIEQIKLSAYMVNNYEPVLVNGQNEFVIKIKNDSQTILPIILHKRGNNSFYLDTNWNFFYHRITQSLLGNINQLNLNSKDKINTNVFGGNMVYLIVTFINNANEDSRIKSISGTLNIDTVFPKASKSRIVMWLPMGAVMELVAMDKNGNILLLDGNSSLIIQTQNPIQKSVVITRPLSNDETYDRYQIENRAKINSDVELYPNIYNLQNKLEHKNIKLFIIGRQRPSDPDEKVQGLPFTEHLMMDENLYDEKIMAVDMISKNILAINGRPVFHVREPSFYKKNNIPSLLIENYNPETESKSKTSYFTDSKSSINETPSEREEIPVNESRPSVFESA